MSNFLNKNLVQMSWSPPMATAGAKLAIAVLQVTRVDGGGR